ncbi:MAG: ABC transporter substrate-binding protein [Leptolyngbyaceae cyanobacterium]
MSPYFAYDSTGHRIDLETPAQRLICLSASGIDALIELGLEPIGGLRRGVAGQPEFYGERVQDWIDVGSWVLPNLRAIAQGQPDLILGWQFPHRLQRWRLATVAPLYLMGNSGYKAAVLRLLDIAYLTGRMERAEAAIAALDQQLTAYWQCLQHHPRKTVLMMGGSRLNLWCDRYPIETDTGTLGSLLQRFTHFPWSKPDLTQGEAGLTYLSLSKIAKIDPDVVLIQSYGSATRPLSQLLTTDRRWQQLKAVQTGQVYEIPQFWHWGNGTRLIQLMLRQILPLIYPSCFTKTTDPVSDSLSSTLENEAS